MKDINTQKSIRAFIERVKAMPPGQRTKILIWIGIAFFLIYIWPTPYEYFTATSSYSSSSYKPMFGAEHPGSSSSVEHPMRRNRFTGTVQAWGGSSWVN